MGSDLPPSPPRMFCGNQNPSKSRRWRGLSEEFKKNVRYNYLGNVKNPQNNRISHFLTVYVQKFGGQIWHPAQNVFGNQNPPKSRKWRGLSEKFWKKRSKWLFRKSKKRTEQSNKPFFNRLRPKVWWSDLTPPPPRKGLNHWKMVQSRSICQMKNIFSTFPFHFNFYGKMDMHWILK